MSSLHNIIRLRRAGHKHHPIFQIVLTLKYKRNRGNFFKKLGFLNLTSKEHSLFIDLHFLGSSLNKGAIVNSPVKKHISKFIR